MYNCQNTILFIVVQLDVITICVLEENNNLEYT